MAALYDLVAMTVSSAPGIGSTISLGNAATINGVTYLSFNTAGTPAGTTVAYSILDTAASEVGTATYLSSGPLLGTRTPTKSTNGNSAINASSAAIILCSPRAEDIISTDLANSFTAAQQNQARTNLGAMALVASYLTTGDLNTIVNTEGFYFVEGAVTNTPVASTRYYVMLQKYTADGLYCHQTAWDATTSGAVNVWVRNRFNGTWSAWQALIGTGAQSLTSAQQDRARLNVGVIQVQGQVGVDTNTVTTTGTYYLTDTCTNLPAAGYWYLSVQQYTDPQYILQEAVALNVSVPTQYTRTRVTGTWGPWQILINTGAQTLTSTQQAQARTNIAADFTSGTVMLFYQAAAPTGWTKLTTQNDKALRVVSGTGGVSGGTNAFSTVMAQTVVGNTTLSLSQIPAHQHGPSGLTSFYGAAAGGGGAALAGGSGAGAATLTDLQGGGLSHNHTITMSIQYIDLILASKN